MGQRLKSEDPDDDLILNGVVFATREEAIAYRENLKSRRLVHYTVYVAETAERPNFQYDGSLKSLS